MKILKLYLKNLNSFRQEVILDFTVAPLSNSNLTVVTGQTGAGKTTLLDAICVALYAKTPRLDGNGDQHPNNMLSQGKKEGIAELTFSSNGRRYLAEWRTKRSASGNFTPSGKLIDLDSSKIMSERLQAKRHSDKDSDPSVADVVTEILGLDFSAFCRSVMLAQGDFSAFLKSKMEQRRSILEATTGTTIYDQLKHELNKIVTENKKKFNEMEARLSASPEVTEEEIQQTKQNLNNKEIQQNELQNKRNQIQSEIAEATQRQEIHKRLIKTSQELEILGQQQEQMDQLKNELELANRALQIQLEMNNFEVSGKELQQAKLTEYDAKQNQKSVLPDWQLASSHFSQADRDYRQAFSDSQKSRKQFQLAREEETLAKSAFNLAKEYTDRANGVKEKILRQKTEIEEKQKQIAHLNKEKDTIESETGRLNYPKGLESLELELRTVQKLLIQGQEKLDRLLETRRHNDKQLTQIELQRKNRKQAQKQLIEHEQNESEIRQKLQNAQQRTKELKNRESDWQNEKKLTQLAQTIANQILTLEAQTKQQTAKNQIWVDELNSQQLELESISQRQRKIGQERENFAQKLRKLEARSTDHHRQIQLNQFRQELELNKPCPVCGSSEHSDQSKVDQIPIDPTEIEKITNQLKKFEKLVNDSQLDFELIHQERVKIDLNCQNLKSQIEQGQTGTNQLENDQNILAQQWTQLYPQEKMPMANEILNWLEVRRTNAEQNLDLLSQAELDQQKASNDVEQWVLKQDQILQLNQTIKQQLQETETEQKTIQDTINRLESEIEFLKKQIMDLMSLTDKSTYSIDDLSNWHLKQLELVTFTRKQEEELQKLNHQVGQLEFQLTKIPVKDLEIEYQQLEDSCQQKIAEGRDLIAAAKSKTDGLSANEAEEKMNQQLDDCFLKREQAESSLQEAEQKKQIVEDRVKSCQQKTLEIEEQHDKEKLFYQAKLKQHDFSDIDAHRKSIRDVKWISEQTTRWRDYNTRLVNYQKQQIVDQQTLTDSPFDSNQLEDLSEKENQMIAQLSLIQQQIGANKQKLDQLEIEFTRRTQQLQKSKSIKEEKRRWEKLQSVIPDNTLRDFALEQMFDMLTRLANQQLMSLTNRYELRVHSMKEMKVVDRWNANQERPVETLSGGESFLTSLSLALALSEMSRGRSQIESLFLDEGFGTLDSETLDVAISALENLRFSGKHVLVISHVRELTRRIPQQIRVDKMNNGSSQVRIKG